ncbi:MAG: META domain-containing protein [Methanomicrobiaceae archaeon]|nr:META domain-containing protein [Methanomicrobiaceae archaeon]
MLVLALVCAGCTHPPVPGRHGGAAGNVPANLTAHTWVLDLYVAGDNQFKPVLNDTRITAVFGADGLLSGSGGCNIYAAQYDAGGELLSIGPVASAKTICSEPPELMNQEAAYLAALHRVAFFAFSSGELRLLDGDRRTVLVFSRSGLSAPTELTGRTWRLTHFDNGMGKILPVVENTTVTANFDPEGFLRGSAGCNAYATTCNAAGEALDIGVVDVTQTFCSRPSGIMQQEATFLSMLKRADTYEIDGNNLVIRNNAGDVILVFESDRSEALLPLGGTLTGRGWHLRRLADNAGEMVPAIPQATVTAAFTRDGHLSGAAGCNWYGTYYRVEGERLFVEEIAFTDFYCSTPEGILEQERQYFSLLNRTASYEIRGGMLSIYDEQKTLLLEFSSDPLGA